MKLEDLSQRIDDLVSDAERVKHSCHTDSSGIRWVDAELKAEVRALALSFLERVFGRDSGYYTKFEKASVSQAGGFVIPLGILRAAQGEIHGGWLFNVKSLVAADIFADYLEMAAHLNVEGYKDAAAVIAGSTLEEHLRQLCHVRGLPVEETKKNGKTVPIRADRMNADLAKAGVYGKLDLKAVTAWLDLRNKAAHGKYGEYTGEQVELMIDAIRDFLTRNPT